MTDQPPGLSFPRDFLWGTATAAHQVEGNNTNSDWWDWEAAGRVLGGQRSGLACDHYRRFEQDFALLEALDQNAHRLSVEWARIEPRPGEFDRAELAHYRAVLESLRKHGIEPVVTLHHFTNPRWLSARGGWANPEVVARFERYVDRVVEALGDLVRYWVTLNEPNIYALYGYIFGTWPPGIRSLPAAFRVLAHMVRAHGRAYHAIHRRAPDARVGIAHHWHPFDPYRERRLDRWTARLRHEVFNRAFARAVQTGVLRFPLGRGEPAPEARDSQDFFGLNYYSRDVVRFSWRHPHLLFGVDEPVEAPRTAFGWEIYPEGLTRSLLEVAAFGKPVLVTENGVSDRNDELRPAYLVSHLRALHRAMEQGAPVIGYLHWSALDNFEWLEGFTQRFGLIAVDFRTQERRVKPSGELYAAICRTGTVPTEPAVAAGPSTPRQR